LVQGIPSCVTLEFKDFQGPFSRTFKELPTTTMHMPKDTPHPVHR